MGQLPGGCDRPGGHLGGGGRGEGPALDEGPLGLGRRECPRWKVRPPGFTETTVRIELFDPVGGRL